LLGKLDTVRRGKERGFNVTNDIKRTSGKFAGRVAKIFKRLPKPLEWQSFYRHDLPILIDFCEEVRKVSIQNDLNRSQIRALETLKEVSSEEFQKVITYDQEPSDLVKGPDRVDSSQIELEGFSGYPCQKGNPSKRNSNQGIPPDSGTKRLGGNPYPSGATLLGAFQGKCSIRHAKEENNRCNQQVRHHFKEKIGL